MADSTTTPAGEGTTQAAPAAQQPGQQERTFTQDEVNRLVGDARKKVRYQFEGYEEYKAQAEARADYDDIKAERDRLAAQIQRRDLLDRVSAATGVPAALLKGETEDELTESAEAVRTYVSSQVPAYPADKGGGATPKPATHADIDSKPRGTAQQRMERLMERAQLIEQESRG